MGGGRNGFPFVIEGRPNDSRTTPVAEFAGVSPNYFDGPRHSADSAAALSLDSDEPEFTARRRHRSDPRQPLLARPGSPRPHIQFQRPRPAIQNWVTIVGVVGDMKSDSFEAPLAPHIYLPVFQGPPYASVLFLRTHANPGTLSDQIRTEVQSVDSNLPLFSVRTLDEVVARSMAERRFALEILALFAGVALLLAAIGIYGVMSYAFSRRIHELGIRIALGAQRSDILRMALSEGMKSSPLRPRRRRRRRHSSSLASSAPCSSTSPPPIR